MTVLPAVGLVLLGVVVFTACWLRGLGPLRSLLFGLAAPAAAWALFAAWVAWTVWRDERREGRP